jgi:hypothetical protein
MRNVAETFVEKMKTHFVFSDFPPESRALYRIMWKSEVQPDRQQMTI